MIRRARSIVLASALIGCASCGHVPETVVGRGAAPLPAESPLPLDRAPKEELRMVPPEVYVRTYLEIFGGLVQSHDAQGLPLDVQRRARAGDGAQLFDTWDDYLGALGFPDYKNDLPRAGQTNALMVATFERIGVALCDRAVEHDLRNDPKTKKPLRKDERVVFAFDFDPKAELDAASFAPKLDVLHQTFLGYPLALAPTDRANRFFTLFHDVRARHADKAAPPSRFSPTEAGWAAVCQGLIRHPELHLY
jgi:hypothetical protein